MSLFPFPGLPKLDGPDGLIGTAQKLAATFAQILARLESIDAHLAEIERQGQPK